MWRTSPSSSRQPKYRRESLLAAGINVHDFAYESAPNACKALEVFDPVPSLITADGHMRNPHKNYGLLTPEALFCLITIGWLMLAEVGRHFSPVEFAMFKEYNYLPDERRYPFIVPAHEHMPTPVGVLEDENSEFCTRSGYDRSGYHRS